MQPKQLLWLFILLLCSCADLPKNVVKLAVLKDEIILECSESMFLNSDDIDFKEQDGYLIANIPKLNNTYFLCYFDEYSEDYKYITMSRVYRGGK